MMNVNKRLVLASGSIRRAEILDQVGIEYQIIPSDFDENSISISDPAQYVKTLAFKKAESVACKYPDSYLVLGADTSVVIDDHILGKPQNDQEARQYLELLSNREHQVYTGISLIRTWDKKTITYAKKTTVRMKQLSEEEINFYISTKEPFDKAGAYGIQGIGARFITSIEGDYLNVVGLPVNLFMDMLLEMGEVHETFTKLSTDKE